MTQTIFVKKVIRPVLPILGIAGLLVTVNVTAAGNGFGNGMMPVPASLPAPMGGMMPGRPAGGMFQNCLEDPAACGMSEEETAGIQACQEDPESEACSAFREAHRPEMRPGLPEECVDDPAACNMTAEQVAGIQACEADPESEACTAFRETHRPEMRPGLPEACVNDPAACNMTAEQVAGIQACEEDRDSEACTAFRDEQWHGTRPPKAPRLLDAGCLENPEGCELPEAHVAGVHACRGNPASEGCQQFNADIAEICQQNPEDEACQLEAGGPVMNCDNNPDQCTNPGPAFFDVNNMTLRVPAIRLRLNGRLSEDFYAVDLKLHDNGQGMSLLQIRALNRQARGQ